MSFMDQALQSYRLPTAEDLEIEIPLRREARKDAAEPSVGQHGGSSQSGGRAGGEGSGDSTAPNDASAPEPQRDDPDDGEHTDSTPEQVAARMHSQDPEPEENPTHEEPPAEPEPVAHESTQSDEELIQSSVDEAAARLEDIEGAHPRAFTRIGFSAGDDVPTVLLKRMPQPLIDKLRVILAPSLGGAFAEAISAPALVTAFLSAQLGVRLDLDENTEAAVDAFRETDPRLSSLEHKVDLALEGMDRISGMVKRSIKRGNETGNLAEVMEFALAFLVTDRVAGLTTADVDETNVDVTHKKVLTARETIRDRARRQRTIEKEQDGRRIA